MADLHLINSRRVKGRLGAHTSTSGGLQQALLEGKQIGATTVQLFTSNQRQWKGRKLTPEVLEVWQQTVEETGLENLMSHASYLINLGSPVEESLQKSRQAFLEEIERCLALNITYLNFHPGASIDKQTEACLDRIIASLKSMAPVLENSSLALLLETTAGQGSSVGCYFEELAYIIEGVKNFIPHIGVCIDTCHIFAAGYDIRSKEKWHEVLQQFDRLIGLSYLQAFHLNDSAKGLGSRVDRHQFLGQGEIGWECFQFLMQDPRTSHLPKYLETPGGPENWKQEIQELHQL